MPKQGKVMTLQYENVSKLLPSDTIKSLNRSSSGFQFALKNMKICYVFTLTADIGKNSRNT